MLLTIRVADGGVRQTHDVAISVEAGHTTADVVAALRTRFELGDDAAIVTVARHGGALAADEPFVASDVIDGDELIVSVRPVALRTAELRHPPVVSLDVVSGPDAGRYLLLGPGRFELGGSLQVGDPQIRTGHAAVTVTADGSVTVEAAAGAASVRGVEVAQVGSLGPTDMIDVGQSRIAFRPLGAHDAAEPRCCGPGELGFHRAPYRPPARFAAQVPELGPVPVARQGRRFAIAAILAPLAGGGMILLGSHRGRIALIALALAPVIGLLAWLDDRRSGRRASRRERRDFLGRADAIGEAVLASAEAERRVLVESAPDLAILRRRAESRDRRLWEREFEAADTRVVRLGSTARRPSVRVEIPDCDEELAAELHVALRGDTMLVDVPATVRIDNAGAVGLCGSEVATEGLLDSILLQLATLQSPNDLVITACVTPRRPCVGWLPWLPHVQAASSIGLDHAVATTVDDAKRLVAQLADLADSRRVRTPTRDEPPPRPWVVVVVDDRLGLDPATTVRLFADAPGFSCIWIGDETARLPRTCATVVTCTGEGTASVWTLADGLQPNLTTIETINAPLARLHARALSALRDVSSTAAVTLQTSVTLSDVVGDAALQPEALAAAWERPRAATLSAPLGLGAEGPVIIDLVEQGPHMLVAGTSGSGKSELLQSLIASLAAAHSPAALSFLLIDYKGGAFGSALERLPHTVGLVTNLDRGLASRALTSLRAELTWRMTVLDGRAKDLDDLVLQGYEAPPRLIIVVDEFATLVHEIPEFVDGIVDIAQRGRSLGIHLVLATQRPTGVVNEKILANTNLRIGLRLLDPAESSSILGGPEAARLPVAVRGRAIVRSGQRATTGIQVAWSGAPSRALGSRPLPCVRGLIESPSPEPMVAGARTQLDQLVDAARRIWADQPRPRRPWLDPLPVALSGSDERLAGANSGGDAGLVLGLRDQPDRQRQVPWSIDLAATGGLLVLGAGGSGRSTALLQMAAVFLAADPGRAVVAITADRRGLAALPSGEGCLDVVGLHDLEHLTRLLSWLNGELLRRRSEGPAGELLVVIDGLGALMHLLERPDLFAWSEVVTNLASQGRALGVFLAASNDRRHGVPPVMQAALSARLVLRHADVEGLIDAGVPPVLARAHELVPGRGWFDGDLVQVAVPVAPIRGAVPRLAPPRPALADHVTLAATEFDDGRVALGSADLTGATVWFDHRLDHFVVAGPPGSGRTTVLSAIEAAARRSGLETVPHAAGAGTEVQRRSLLLIDEADISDDPMLEALVMSVLRNRLVRIVAAVDTRTLAGGYQAGWLGELRRWRQQLVLQPAPLELNQLVGPRFAVRPGLSFPPGRGVFITPSTATVMQVAMPRPSDVTTEDRRLGDAPKRVFDGGRDARVETGRAGQFAGRGAP